MAFLRFSRDKRGYEHFQLVQPAMNRRGSGRPRILYWFRSPSNVRVGREPFDDAVRIAIEKQNPELEFDWTQILATPIPSADADRWRERRRLERAARQVTSDEEEPESNDAQAIGDLDTKTAPPEDQAVTENLALTGNNASSPTERPPAAQDGSARRGRRRRRGRRGRPDTEGAKAGEVTAESSKPDPEFESDPD